MESGGIQIRLFLLHIPHFPIQVSDNISQEDAFERKLSRLQKIHDARPKTIIAKTGHDPMECPNSTKSARSTAPSRFFSPTYKPMAVVSSG